MLIRLNPEQEMRRLSRNFDSLFDWPATAQLATTFAPAVDVEETADKFVIHADMPGLKEKDIEVSFEDGVLTLSGKREWNQERKEDGYRVRERGHGSFHRQFRLSPRIDNDKIDASYKNGVLIVSLPKRPEVKPRQIAVKGE